MDITALSTALSSVNTMNDFSVAMLSKTLDTTRDIEEGLISMIDATAMEQSVNPNIGGNIDISV